MVPRPEYIQAEADARAALEQHQPYEYKGVLIECVRTPGAHTYRVTCEGVVVADKEGLGTAVSSWLMYCN